MLVVNRKTGESFTLDTIDGKIEVKILKGMGSIRIGINAPKDISILRDDAIKKIPKKSLIK